MKAADWHRDCVVKANMRLVISIVKKFVNANNAFDDLLSDGIVALMRAVDKFDYDRGFRFSTYATQVVRRNAYRMVVQKQRERTKIVGNLQDNGLDISDEDRAPTIDEHKWHELRARLALLMDNLDRREKLIIRARFSLGGHRTVQTLQRLADKLGRDVTSIHDPVPRYRETLGAATDSAMSAIGRMRPRWRVNWTLLDDPALFQPTAPTGRTHRPGLESFLRVERQCLVPIADVIVFSIRTSVLPVAELDESKASALLASVAGSPDDLAAYRGWNV